MLHLLALPPGEADLLDQAIRLISPNDAVVFLDEGLALLQDQALLAAFRHCQCFVWSEPSSAATGFPHIDAQELVVLSEQHPTCLSWYPEAK